MGTLSRTASKMRSGSSRNRRGRGFMNLNRSRRGRSMGSMPGSGLKGPDKGKG